MSLREDMWKYEQITGESAEHVPIIKLGAFLDGYETGLKAVEQQPSEDVISRKAVLDVVRKWFDKMQLNGDICIDGIISLPSVTPRNNLAESSQVRITLEEEIMKLDLIASDAFEGGDANEFRQLAEWLRELKIHREIHEVLLQMLLDCDIDICCEDLTDDDDEELICMENCNNKTKDCWLRWAKLKAREGSNSE